MDEKTLRSLTPEDLERLQKEGFDRSDPSGSWIVGSAAAIVITLVIVVLSVDYLFQETLSQNEYEVVLSKDSPELQEVRTKEAEQLNHYRYIDQEKGVVRLPIDRAMDLFAAEAAGGKLFYPAKSAPVKTPEMLAAAGGEAPAGAAGAAAAGSAGTNPAGAGVEPKK